MTCLSFYETNQDDNIVRIFVIRHGQTADNVNKILQGHKDTPLNNEGIKQADQLGVFFVKERGVRLDKVYSSDLTRCRQTIEKVLDHYDEKYKPEIEYTEELRERYMGVIQGMHVDDAEKYAAEHGKNSFRDFGETAEEFGSRVRNALQSIISKSMNHRNIAIMAHGGTIRQLLDAVLPGVKRIIVYNTSVTVIDCTKRSADCFEVRHFSTTSHLGNGEFIVRDYRLR